MHDIPPSGPSPIILGPLAEDLPFMIRNLHALLRPVGHIVRDPLGIESGSIGILSMVWVNPGISQNDLAANLAMKKSAIAKLVKSLEQDGLLDRTRVPGDRRMNALTLTAQGHQMVGQIRRLTQALNDDLARDIPAHDREVFFRVLEKLHASLAAREQAPASDGMALSPSQG